MGRLNNKDDTFEMIKINEIAARGVLYIAFGERYIEELRVSVKSLRTVSPQLGIAVVTDHLIADLENVQFILQPPIRSLESKPAYMICAPFAQTMYLDTDTYIARDIEPLFGLLDFYDFLAQWGGARFGSNDGLDCHARIHSGMMIFKRTINLIPVFENWLSLYKDEKLKTGDLNLADERSLTECLARSQLRLGVLPPYAQIGLNAPWVFFAPPMVLHGRPRSFEALSRHINQGWNPATDWAPRIWLPNLQGLLPRGLRRSDPLLGLALVGRRLWNELRYWLEAITSQLYK